jgi:hypothetical protein
MGFVWNVYERISDLVGPVGAIAVFAGALGFALYLLLGSSSPSRR